MCTHVHNEYIMKHVKTKSLLLLERIQRGGRRKKKQQLKHTSIPSAPYVFANETNS